MSAKVRDPRDALPPDPFTDAVDEYRDRFGAETLPFLWMVDPAVAARALRMAVTRGRPIRQAYVISRICGGWRHAPPPELVL
jgi:hypothetical protein